MPDSTVLSYNTLLLKLCVSNRIIYSVVFTENNNLGKKKKQTKPVTNYSGVKMSKIPEITLTSAAISGEFLEWVREI